MPTNSNYDLRPASEEERAYLESLIREDFERCHPGETLEDFKRRASFSKEDKGLLRDWMAIAASRAAADQANGPQLNQRPRVPQGVITTKGGS
jgi:5'-deoxynucleotidase YfbR-like HD superfamily hydrolase